MSAYDQYEGTLHKARKDLCDAIHDLKQEMLDALSPVLLPIVKWLNNLLKVSA